MTGAFSNPFKPGAGHMPPYLAGREKQIAEFQQLLQQSVILKNPLLTGLRGLGKTVLAETLKPIATEAGWIWLGNDLSETASLSEVSLATRILVDLSPVTETLLATETKINRLGFGSSETMLRPVGFDALSEIWSTTPGLSTDKLKEVLERVWENIATSGKSGIIFAYDEAQILSDHAERHQYPLSMLLDAFQSLQRKELPLMLVMSGLPTVLPNLVAARTYAERMFQTITLDRLSYQECLEAVTKPIQDSESPVTFSDQSVKTIFDMSRGYPYFVQYACREAFDIWVTQSTAGQKPSAIPIDHIERKLHADFFAGRWARLTPRQRDLLTAVAQLENADTEFTVPEIMDISKATLEKPFTRGSAMQTLSSLEAAHVIYKDKRGRYSLALPLLNEFIKQQSPIELQLELSSLG